MTSASISPQSNTIGEENTEIQFSVTLANDLPQNGKILLQTPYWFPTSSEGYVFSGTTSCSLSGSAVSCSWDESTRILSVSSLSAASAGDTLTFTADGYRNPYNPLEKNGYFIYSADSDGYLVN